MTYEEKRAWLGQYRVCLRREHELAEEVEQLRARACRTAAALDGLPAAAPDGGALPRAVEQIVAAREELQAQIGRCTAARRAVAAAVEGVADPRDREILRRRYLLGQRWEKIADALRLDPRWVTRCHRRAVEGMALPPVDFDPGKPPFPVLK